MPTTYAHYRMGKQAIQKLPADLQEVIKNNRELFDIGVHGPDIFFYYNALVSNPVSAFGSRMHTESMRVFLEKVKPLYQKSTQKEAFKAYLLGFTAHFTLDSYCHGYVERKEESDPRASHSRIESQFDRYLLVKDGFNPIRKSVTFSLKPSKKNAQVIQEAFPEWRLKDIHKTIRDQKFYLDLLKANSTPKRWVLELGMRISGHPEMLHLLIDREEFDYCKDANMRLHKLSYLAAKHYPELAEEVIAYLEKDGELSAYFDHHFGPKADYREIPILSAEAEAQYRPEKQA